MHRPASVPARADRIRMPVTYTVMAVCIVLWGLMQLPGGEDVAYRFALKPFLVGEEPWTVVSSAFLHDSSSAAHISTNMLSLWIFGRMLEPTIGSVRFGSLLGVSILAGSVGVILLEDPYSLTVGLSGGIFGLIAGVLMIQLAQRQNISGTLVLLGVNAAMAFLVPNISWQGHLGGFLGGLAYSAVAIAPRITGRRRRTLAPHDPAQPVWGDTPPE